MHPHSRELGLIMACGVCRDQRRHNLKTMQRLLLLVVACFILMMGLVWIDGAKAIESVTFAGICVIALCNLILYILSILDDRQQVVSLKMAFVLEKILVDATPLENKVVVEFTAMILREDWEGARAAWRDINLVFPNMSVDHPLSWMAQSLGFHPSP